MAHLRWILAFLISVGLPVHAEQANQIDTDINQFPHVLIQSIIAAEDPAFHDRQLWRSPITSRTVRLLEPSKNTDHWDLFTDTVYLGWRYSHDELLAVYLSKMHFGRGCTGAKAAAMGFFAKPLIDITLTEAVMLVAVSRRPVGGFADDPFMRRNVDRITTQMLENETITADQRDEVIIENANRTAALRGC